MFNFICKSFPHMKKHCVVKSTPTHEYVLQLSLFSIEAVKPTSDNAKDHSFTVNYLTKTCGFAPEKAISASKYVNFNKPDKPHAVISFLKKQGFSETQVLKMIRTFPPVVLSDPEKTLLPKIEFFLSQGFSKADLTAMFTVVPRIFKMSLERKIIPSFNWLKKLFGSAEDTIVPIIRCPLLFSFFQHNVVPNVEILRKAGVPQARIRSFLRNWPRGITRHPDKFKEVVEEVRKMGVDPLKSTFFTAVHVMLGLSRPSWKKKMEVYKKWGCSEDEVLAAFLTNPWCMSVSVDKIEGIMGFFVNEMGWDASMLMQKSHILSLSLNRRIIPRGSVYRVLLSKGFIKENPSLFTLLCFSEEIFRKRCVECYKKEAPELLKLYQEKMKLLR